MQFTLSDDAFLSLFVALCFFVTRPNACLAVCVKELDVVLPDWPSAVLYDGSQSICYCRHEAVILPVFTLSLSIDCDLSSH